MRFASLLLKELIQFFRDRVILLLILWLYTAEVIICAFALSFDVKDLPLAVLDLDRTVVSRTLIQQFTSTEAFRPVGRPRSMATVGDWLESGRAHIVLIVPKGFGADIRRNTASNVQILLDGSNSNVAATARGYAERIIHAFQNRVTQGAAPPMQVTPVLRIWYNPRQSFTPFVVLSMIALAALMVGVIHPAASIVREKEVGTIEQLRVTPIRTSELFVAKTLPTLLMGLLSIFPSLLIVRGFDVPLRGSLFLFMALSALFLVSAIGIGVLVATICKTLQQALLLSFFGLVPLMFLSGTLVPVESMPEPLQVLSLASPLRHYMTITLGIFLKGADMTVLWPETLALAVIGACLFGAAAVIFRVQSGVPRR
ncbi:ABC transporter permease [Thiohalomonas denitrificans]|uniref:Transport permease protein n=1 Tax=Thiohalomonas denitrificans TaxID=415747 RepID=A0A1G5Q0E5_9GAMM|nr:ABC transporter permease [Thiohalomonas denitrificans]SCZ55335.1 ABC-2 type transport system permease protein [Thiohalomonas denitrificans]